MSPDIHTCYCEELLSGMGEIPHSSFLVSKKTCLKVKLTLLLLLLLSPSVHSRPPVKSQDHIEGRGENLMGDNIEAQAQEPDLEKDEHKAPEEKQKHPMAAAIAAAGSLLPLDDLKLPDHLDGVRMEQDGHLNRDYHKEVIIGNHEEFEEGDEEEKEKKLREIFFKVDTDLDTYISQEELEEWIQVKVQEHFDESTDETERIFKHLDSDKDGTVAWEEFHVHFLLAKGVSAEEAEKQVSDYYAVGSLDPDAKENLIRYKFRWAEADLDPQDNKLTMEEFASFRHPEQSKDMLERLVKEIMDNLDQDSNDEISLKEFVALPPGEIEYAAQDSDKMWQNEREKEFKEVVDLNSDGKITKDELKVYMDPKNPTHSRSEAASLIQMADENNDGKLSLTEVLDNEDLFMGSKMVHTGQSFHDEF